MLRRIRQLAGTHRVELLTGLAASLPVIASAIHAVAAGWVPVGDNAAIATRSYDVLTGHTPLVGQYSTSSGLAGAPTYSPGPLEYWLLALPARLFGPAALAVTASALNVGSVMGVVVVARRRGGLPLMFLTGVALALLSSSLGAETLHSIWNPYVALLPFTLLIFLCWSVACGEFRLLPLVALVSSFVIQCHLVYAPPVLALLAVAAAGLAASRRALPRRALSRWTLAALLVGLVCWSAPLVEQASHRPGNLVLLSRVARADEPRVGADAGLHALVRAVGVSPWWLRDPRPPDVSFLELGGTQPTLGVISCVLLLAGLCLITSVGLRRRQREVATGGCAALALCAALVLVTASVPAEPALSPLVYIVQWGGPVGMFTWVVLVWAPLALFRPGWRPRALRTPRAALAGIAAVAAVGLAVAAATGADRQEPSYSEIRTLSDRLESRLPGGSPILIETEGKSSQHGFDMQMASVYALRQHGFAVSDPPLERLFGGWYGAGGRPDDHVLVLGAGRPSSREGELIVRIPPSTTPSALQRALGSRPDPSIYMTLLRD